MILRTSSLRYQVLRILSDDPMDCRTIASHLFPPPKLDGVPSSAGAWKARAIAVEAWKADASRKVGRVLDWGQASGLIEPCGSPSVSNWFVERMDRYGLSLALQRVHPSFPREVPDLRGHMRMIESVLMWRGVPGDGQCTERPGYGVSDLLGRSPSGARKRVWRELVDWGVCVSPSQRVLTSAGVAMVRRMSGYVVPIRVHR